MKEFMLLIRNNQNHQSAWSSDYKQQFLKKCEIYINNLKKQGKLISAQPFVMEGIILSGKAGNWVELPYNESEEVQVGYYHIVARDLDEAIELSKLNPEFEFGSSARIEIRPIKTKENITGYIYPRKV